MARFVDVHTHLTHAAFAGEQDAVIARAVAAGVDAIVVNGLEPRSNREVLALAERHAAVKPALGIYPIDAVNELIPTGFPYPVPRFDVDAEIVFIRELALAGRLAAVGECGLDGHWVDASTFPLQERVFEALIGVALEADLPLVIHTRKLEVRAAEILAAHGVQKVNFHCFGGRTSLARDWAERHGWWFSIPANARVNQAFGKMLRELPLERILTETDAPYMPPTRGERNEPANVVGTVAFLAELRGLTLDAAQELVAANYRALFGPRWC
jgi:TatD DNase family protein